MKQTQLELGVLSLCAVSKASVTATVQMQVQVEADQGSSSPRAVADLAEAAELRPWEGVQGWGGGKRGIK